MTCYHPNLVVMNYSPSLKKNVLYWLKEDVYDMPDKFIPDLLKQINEKMPEDAQLHGGKQALYSHLTFIPCGHCRGCLLARSRDWAVRCIHESYSKDYKYFITLTFNDVYVSKDLDKTVYQKFLKRLRKNTACDTLSYFGCGEYGGLTHRPHYHFILFSQTPLFNDLFIWQMPDLYRSPTLESLWPYGYSSIKDVTFGSCAYVARYCLKKADIVIDEKSPNRGFNSARPFGDGYTVASLRPAIGLGFYNSHKHELYGSGYTVVHNRKFPLPKFYDKRYKEEFPDLYRLVQENRQKYVFTDFQDATKVDTYIGELQKREESSIHHIEAHLKRRYEDGES